MTNDGPLSNEEVDELAQFFMSDDFPNDAMEISGVHGFLTAVVSGPALIKPSEWLSIVLPEDKAPFRDLDQARRVYGLIMRLYNEINFTLTDAPDFYDPLLLSSSDGGTPRLYGCAWASGYIHGLQFRLDAWPPYFGEPVVAKNLETIVRFTDDAPNEPLPRGIRRAQVSEELAGAAHAIHAFFLKLRNRERTVRRSAPRVGRNAPCPCGSAKKFKVCCGLA